MACVPSASMMPLTSIPSRCTFFTFCASVQVRGEQVDLTFDSFGVILYEMVGGKRAFASRSFGSESPPATECLVRQ